MGDIWASMTTITVRDCPQRVASMEVEGCFHDNSDSESSGSSETSENEELIPEGLTLVPSCASTGQGLEDDDASGLTLTDLLGPAAQADAAELDPTVFADGLADGTSERHAALENLTVENEQRFLEELEKRRQNIRDIAARYSGAQSPGSLRPREVVSQLLHPSVLGGVGHPEIEAEEAKCDVECSEITECFQESAESERTLLESSFDIFTKPLDVPGPREPLSIPREGAKYLVSDEFPAPQTVPTRARVAENSAKPTSGKVSPVSLAGAGPSHPPPPQVRACGPAAMPASSEVSSLMSQLRGRFQDIGLVRGEVEAFTGSWRVASEKAEHQTEQGGLIATERAAPATAHQASSTKELQFRPSPTAKSVDSECLAGTPVVPSDAGAVQNPKTQTPNEPLPHSEERLRAGLAEETIRREELWLRFLAGDDGPVGGESLPPPDLFRS